MPCTEERRFTAKSRYAFLSPRLEPSERNTRSLLRHTSAAMELNFAFTGAWGLSTRTLADTACGKASRMASAQRQASVSMRSYTCPVATAVMSLLTFA